jgi:hypothetical protein
MLTAIHLMSLACNSQGYLGNLGILASPDQRRLRQESQPTPMNAMSKNVPISA